MPVFSWGSATEGQLGLSCDEDAGGCIAAATEVSLPSDQKVRSISCGSQHTCVLLQDGTVFTCGANNSGQLGRQGDHFKLVQVLAVETLVICQVSCGDDHTLAVSDKGQVLSWGHNDRGQCGMATGDQDDKPKPRIMKSLGSYHVVQVSCGSRHSLALTRDGRVFSWGDNSVGQLGIGSTTPLFSDCPLVIRKLRGLPITQLSCGGSHSFALTISGAPFGWGKNDCGQLGIGAPLNVLSPQILKSLLSQRVKYIACGQDHTAMLIATGGIFLFGCGKQGQLGHGSKDNESNPKKVLDLMGSMVTQVACGRHHTLVLEGHTGKMYSFGEGSSGQLGLTSTKSHSTPMPVPGPWRTTGRSKEDSATECAVLSIYARGDQCFCTVSSSSDSETPKDFREPIPSQRPVTLTENLLLELSTVVPTASPPQRAKELADMCFSSAACLNASFLKEDTDQCDFHEIGADHEVDLDAARSAFQPLSDKTSVLQMISGLLNTYLLPSLMQADGALSHAESLRLYLLLMECPVLSKPKESWCRETISKLARAFLHQRSSALDTISVWWAGLLPRHLNRILTVHKDCVKVLLDKGVRQPISSTATEDTQTRLLCMKMLHMLNTVNCEQGEILPYYLFHIPDLGKSIEIHDHFKVFILKSMGEMADDMFTFCDFPFVFDADTKTQLLQLDAFIQMHFAVESTQMRFFHDLFFDQVNVTQPFLLLCILRDNIVSSTIDQLSGLPQTDLKKPLRVIFVGEEGVDAGGVRKEFFMLIMREFLDQKYGMFKTYEDSGKIWFNSKTFEEDRMFHLVGLVCGLAIYNHTIISLPFPLALYKKLLKRKTTLEDFKQLEPQVAHNLQAMLDYEDEESFSDTFPLVFQIDEDNFGQVQTTDLVPNGGQIEVSFQNRQQYVDAYVEYVLNGSIREKFDAFITGFLDVVGIRILRFFHPQELMSMVVGKEDLNWEEFEESVEYKGEYHPYHETIKLFWQVFREMSVENKKKFLTFLTGSDHVPIQGLKSLRVIFQPVKGGEQFLPVAHTCFNLLDLPMYTSKEVLKEKLLTAVEHTEGFGLV
ncbi:probable E3 ubiquitin-protein ligase HERC4 isoform X2 [Diadema antillarum]|uniref:probable E3 ubiquitin-protein ligase HERC4 isoform X2 n=1 Tax=Diadema antillarum TaxID=105358 RepID=UPI003A854E06